MGRSAKSSLAVAAAAFGVTAAVVAAARALTATPPPEGAVILITGGSRGLGFAIASRFAERPVNLALAARDFAELEEAQASLLAKHPHLRPENFYLITADLAKPEECQRMVNDTFARFGRIDILVNNAGTITVGPVQAMTADLFEHTMRVNFLAAMQACWAALPRLMAQNPAPGWSHRAAIINISSIGGKFAVPHLLPYSAAKFALTGFSEGLYAELKGKGIHVLTVCPGLMRTGGENHAIFFGDKEAEARWFKFCGSTPVIATTVEHASNKIFTGISQARSEITITPQAYLGARFAGLFPGALNVINRLTNDYLLPKP